MKKIDKILEFLNLKSEYREVLIEIPLLTNLPNHVYCYNIKNYITKIKL